MTNKFNSPGTPQRLPVVPLRDMVVGPNTMTTVFMSRPVSVSAAQAALKETDAKVVLLTQRQKEVDEPKAEDLWDVGVVGEITQLLRLPDGSVKGLVRGLTRCSLKSLVLPGSEDPDKDYYEAVVEDIPTLDAPENELAPFRVSLVSGVRHFLSGDRKVSAEVFEAIEKESDPVLCCDLAAAVLPLSTEERIAFIREIDPFKRFDMLLELMQRLQQSGQIDRRIQMRVKDQMDRNQREYYLNEQMKAIRKELGMSEDEDGPDDTAALEKKVREAKLPAEVQKAALEEVRRLKGMSPTAAEAAVVRGYVDTLLDLPWTKKCEVNSDIEHARQVLDEDHWGLKKVKERILEYLAVQKRQDKMKAPILCLVGGPGVGKTSLGRSIARATNRNYVRMALGGIADEAEIRGHRRTYVGAMPGQVIKHLMKAGVRNPLFLLDEIDKISGGVRGDPNSALLEVLDPEQNNSFEDHYVELPFDLSDVFFVATSNSYNIPPALLDRMEVIDLEGYTEDEKVHIAEQHLVGKQMRACGIKEDEVRIERSAILEVIRYYTREAGVRQLERTIGRILRKILLEELEKKEGKPELPIVVDDKAVEKYLGIRQYDITEAERAPAVGYVNGLAWSSVGGDILNVEVVTFPGKGNVIRTGSLGDVMKESVEAARSVVRSRAASFGIPSDVFYSTDWHVHFPEGATPKDGPSAGAAITTAMVSSLTGIPVRSDVAMTGEITLRGRVTAIGGLKEKLLAAARGGVRTVLVPDENRKDMKEIGDDVLKDLKVVYVKTIDDVLKEALVRMPEPLAANATAAATEAKPEAQGAVPPAPASVESAPASAQPA